MKDFFNKNGYVVIRPRELFEYSYFYSYKELKNTLNNSASEYVNKLKLFSQSTIMQNMILSLKDTLTIFLGEWENIIICDTPIIHVMSDELKIDGGYHGTAPHQDWASTQGALNMITVWVPFQNTLWNYPLEVVPGSHLMGLKDGMVNGSVLEIGCDKDFVALDAMAGDVVILSGFLIHRTGMNGKYRVAVSQKFESTKDKTYSDRGFPSNIKRVVDRDIKWKPSVEQVRAVYA